MSGNLKPNISGLGKEIIPTILGYFSSFNMSPSTLFDGINNDNNYYYWVYTNHGSYQVYDYITLVIPSKCNIWRCGTIKYENKISSLKILKHNGSSYDDVTSLYPQTVTAIDNTKWEKTISNLPAGQYQFCYNGERVDSEWYVEENVYKCLIMKGNQYYSVKDNTLTLLGTPADDTQKEKWFNDNGVGDLKSALLTPQSDGSKLIDKLDDKFEIRMMRAKV